MSLLWCNFSLLYLSPLSPLFSSSFSHLLLRLILLPVLPINTDGEWDDKYACVHIFNTCRRDSNFWWFCGRWKTHVLWFSVTGKVFHKNAVIIIVLLVSLPSLFLCHSLFFSSPPFFSSSLISLPPFLSEDTAVSWKQLCFHKRGLLYSLQQHIVFVLSSTLPVASQHILDKRTSSGFYFHHFFKIWWRPILPVLPNVTRKIRAWLKLP